MLVQTGYLKSIKIIYAVRQNNQIISKMSQRTQSYRDLTWMFVRR